MTDEQKPDQQHLPEAKTEEKGALWNQQIADMVIKAIGGGGFATFISLFIASDLPKIATAGAIGAGAEFLLRWSGQPGKRRRKVQKLWVKVLRTRRRLRFWG